MTESNRMASGKSGFTLVELIVVMAIVAILLTMGLPALQNSIHRAKVEGAARTTATMMRNARFEAIKQAVPVVVRVDTSTNDVVSFVDANADFVLDPGELKLGQMILPSGVTFAAPASQSFVDGLDSAGTAGWASFVTNGSVDAAGAFRIADSRGNFLEVRVAPAATARIQLRKWDGSNWHFQGEGGSGWSWY